MGYEFEHRDPFVLWCFLILGLITAEKAGQQPNRDALGQQTSASSRDNDYPTVVIINLRGGLHFIHMERVQIGIFHLLGLIARGGLAARPIELVPGYEATSDECHNAL